MDILEHLIEDYGLLKLLEQNDIEERTVLEMLIHKGCLLYTSDSADEAYDV